jgi:hypothetical protein
MAGSALAPQWLWVYLICMCTAFIAGCTWFIVARRRRGFAQTWSALAPVVDGTFTSSPTRSTLSGTFQSRPVRAQLWKTSEDSAGGYGVEVATLLRAGDWAIEFGTDRIFEREHWRVKAHDAAVAETIERSGALGALAGVPTDVTISYDSRGRVLVYSGNPGRLTRDAFERQLKLLLEIEARVGAHLSGMTH